MEAAFVESVFFIDADLGWAIGRTCPPGEPCRPALARTLDGGQTWEGLPTPPEGRAQLRFRDPLTGWLKVYGGLFVTHDGGQSWVDQARSNWVEAFVPGPADVWVIERGCTARPPDTWQCPLAVLISADDGQTWQPAAALPLEENGYAVQLVRGGAQAAWVIVSTASAGNVLFATRDAGQAWEGPYQPCAEYGLWLDQLAAADAAVVWALCGGQPDFEGGHAKLVLVSADGGLTWSSRAGVDSPEAVSGLLYVSKVNDFVALSEQEAWMTQCPGSLPASAAPSGPLIVTRDGGVSWTGASPAAPAPADCLFRVGFSDALHGWAWGDYTLARTQDGGLSWLPVAWPATFLSTPYPGPDWRPTPLVGYPR